MTREVLVTLDGSDLSRSVLYYLPAILRQGDNVVLLTIAREPSVLWDLPVEANAPVAVGPTFTRLTPQLPVYLERPDGAIEAVRDGLIDYLRDEALFLRNEGFDVTCDVVFANDAARAIVSYARERAPLFIAMATHGRGGLDHAVHGSVTEAVIRSGVAPVLVVRPK